MKTVLLLAVLLALSANAGTHKSSSTVKPANGGVGTNQDTIIVARTQEYLFWEDTAGPYLKVFEETLSGTMQIRLQAYQYCAFTAERYGAATALIQGTGNTPPTF